MARLVPVDDDPFAAAPAGAGGRLVAVEHDPFAEAPAAPPQAEARAYEPTWREQIASWLMGDSRSPERERLVSGLVGTSGPGAEERIGVVDFTPGRIPLFAQEAKRALERGDIGDAALDTLGALPIPVLNKGLDAVGSAAGKAASKIVETIPVVEAAERLGLTLPRGGGKAADVVKEVPGPLGGRNPLTEASGRALEQIEAKGDDLAARVTPEAREGFKFRDPAAASETRATRSVADWLNQADDDALEAAQKAAEPPSSAPVEMPEAVTKPAPAPNLEPDGSFRIITPDQSMEISARPQLVELEELKLAEGRFQPRDRSRAEYATEAIERANRLDPAQLMPGRVSDSGAPIVLPDGTILSGNGRAMSIARVYSNPDLAERAAAYRTSLGPEAANMRHPVLVMRADDMDPDTAARFADLSNRGRIASMSATERAARDAQALGSDGVALYQGGDFEAPQNAAFLRSFMDKAVTAGERTSISKGGRLTQEGVQRMRNAVLAAAYEDTATLSRMLESTDDNIRNLTGALTDAAPHFAQLKADIRAGVVMPEMDAAPYITQAVRLIGDLRNQGTTAERWFAQLDAFDDTDPMVREFVRAFHTDDLSRPLSRQRMSEVLTEYATEARKHAPGGLFDDPTTAADVLNVARRGPDGSTQGAGAESLGSTLASDGAGDAASRIEAGRSTPDGVGQGTIRGGEPAGDGLSGAAGNGRDGQARNRLTQFLPKPKTAQEIVQEAKRKRIGGILGIDDADFAPSAVTGRVHELVNAGKARDVETLLKTKQALGDEAWESVANSVLARMGLTSSLDDFARNWSALSANGKNSLLGGNPLKGELDDLAKVLETVPRLERLSSNTIERTQEALSRVPIIGGLLAGRLANAGTQVFGGFMTGGLGTAAQLGGTAVSKYLSRPQNVKSLTRWLRAYNTLAKAKGKSELAVFALAARNLAKQLADEFGGDEREIASDLQAVGAL